MDVLCQAKSGMGKTAVFVITVLQQLEPVQNEVGAVVLCHTRGVGVPDFSTRALFDVFGRRDDGVVFGGIPIVQQKEQLKLQPPNIVVGTPGRLKTLALDGTLNLKKCARTSSSTKCDKMLEEIDMRSDVQEIFQVHTARQTGDDVHRYLIQGAPRAV